MLFKEIKNALTGQPDSLEVTNIKEKGKALKALYLNEEKDSSRWLEIISEKLRKAKTFEIHCWNGEEELMEKALIYGEYRESSWAYGKIIAGQVTADFISMIINMPAPRDTEAEIKMTPFFNIFLDDDFQSCHYGTEIYF